MKYGEKNGGGAGQTKRTPLSHKEIKARFIGQENIEEDAKKR